MKILGVHGGVTPLQHEPSAALILDGVIVAAMEEERFSRKKNAAGTIPVSSIQAALREGNIKIEDVDLLVHPGSTSGDLEDRIKIYMEHYFGHCPPVLLVNHQSAHMASAYFCSPFEEAICLSYDGYGDALSGAAGIGSAKGIDVLETFSIPQSLGRLYSAITSFLGFEIAEAEYKVMGLAAYGKQTIDLSPVIRFHDKGFEIDDSFFRATDRTQVAGARNRTEPPVKSLYEPWYSQKFVDLYGPPLRRGEPLVQRHMDMAASVQAVFERASLAIVQRLYERTKIPFLAMAGGCALNCKANGLIRRLPYIKDMFVQPAASDRGLALGAALLGAHEHGEAPRGLDHVFLGPRYSEEDIVRAFDIARVRYSRVADPAKAAAERLARGEIIGWFQGRSEFGPRALGHRSILADPTRPSMKDEINKRVKFREEFRPFAPAVLDTAASTIFEMQSASPFMTMAVSVKPEWIAKLPAVTHVDGTARVQTVSATTDPVFFKLIEELGSLSGAPVVLNTSFNVRGEPIVETPLNAIATFSASGLNALFVENFLVEK